MASSVFENSSKKSIHYDVGIAERTKTFIVFSIMILFTESISTVLMIFNGISYFEMYNGWLQDVYNDLK